MHTHTLKRTHMHTYTHADLWARGRYDEAFSTALEAGGGILDWLLRKAPPESILEIEPCVLSPGVLLSLLTHLAAGVIGNCAAQVMSVCEFYVFCVRECV